MSPENEGGYPGTVHVEVIYRLESNQNLLSIEYRATSNKDTPIDLTNHAYFNLNGHTSGIEIYNHELQIFSDAYLDFNPADLLVTGEIKSVTNTKYDFRNFTLIGNRMQRKSFPDEGFDNYFISNQQSGKKHVASVKNPSNGIKLDIFSDQNGVQFYTSNFLNVTTSSVSYGIHNAFCLETHNYPDAVNKVSENLTNRKILLSLSRYKVQVS
jgi:aldose 1-epimerase